MFEYLLHLANLIVIYSMLGVSMNLVLGYLGILYLAHPAMYGIGAYTVAILTTTGHTNFFLALLLGGVFAGLAGLILSLPSLRLKSHYIGMTTLGFLIITFGLFTNLRDVTRGALGIPGIPRPEIFGIILNTNGSFLIFNIIIAAILLTILYKILNSPFSKVIEAIREDETAAKTLGKNTALYKIQAFTISAFFGGIGGGLFASYLGFINPSSFNVHELIIILTIVIIGGMGSFWGGIAGSLLIFLLFEPLRFLQLNPEIIGALRYGIYGLLLILFMIFRPNGLFGKRTNIFSK